MDYRFLGKTGLKVSELCLGAMTFGWSTTEEDSFAMMDQALEMGINFLGTLPFDPDVVKNCDKGTPIGDQNGNNMFVASLDQSIGRILKHLGIE